MRQTLSFSKFFLLLFALGALAAGCASSKCDCPKVHNNTPVEIETQV